MAKFKVGDKVRVLDGSKIDAYFGGWIYKMEEQVGKVFTISRIIEDHSDTRTGYKFKERKHFDFVWDERGLKLVSEGITITRHGDKVVAKYGKKVGVAKCSPDDTFDFAVGAKLAFSRLMGEPEDKPKPNQEFKVGEYVRVIGNSRFTHWFPIGSIVRIMDVYKTIGKVSCYGLSFCHGEYSFSKQVINNTDLEHLPENTHAD